MPLVDISRAAEVAKEAIELGCKGLVINSRPPKLHSPSHIGFDPLWALAQDGFEPCGFLFEFCRYHVWHVTSGVQTGTVELTQASQAVEKARSIASGRPIPSRDRTRSGRLLRTASWSIPNGRRPATTLTN